LDLARLIEVAGDAGDVWQRAKTLLRRRGHPEWAQDEESFYTHFGVHYEDYLATLEHLSDEQRVQLDATLAVNPEAAVLWVLHMEEIG